MHISRRCYLTWADGNDQIRTEIKSKIDMPLKRYKNSDPDIFNIYIFRGASK